MGKKFKISHYPQVHLNKSFEVEVSSLEEASKIRDILANYDLFQYENKIKPDYCNTTILQEYNDETKEWEDWYDEETGTSDIKEYFELKSEEKEEAVLC